MVYHRVIHIRIAQSSISRKIRRRNRIVKSFNKIRNKRHRQSKGKTKSENKNRVYEVIAPSRFCIHNIICIISFLHRIDAYCRNNKINILKVNLDNVIEIDMYSISLMLSFLNKLSYRNIFYWGTYPKNEEAKSYIINSGFLDVVKTNLKKPSNKKTENQIYMVGKDFVDSHRIGLSVREAMEHLVGYKTVYPPCYDDMLEISANSVEHANDSVIEKNWLVSISLEGECLHFILTDTGLGILATLRKKKIQKVTDALTVKGDASVLRDVFKKVYQSITGETNRHKGLPIIYESFDDGYISNLQVLTNKTMIDFETGESFEFKQGFNGVMFSWTVSMENYNKWLTSL